jgi:cytochrome b561
MIRNTTSSYGRVAKWLHWLTALFVLAAYASILYLDWVFDMKGPQRGTFLQLHKCIGFSVLVFVVLRLYWRFTNPHPALPASMPRWQVTASNVSHFLLYFFLLAMPLSGYIGNSNGVDYGLFKVAAFKNTGWGIWLMEMFNTTYEKFEVGFDSFHYRVVGPYIFWVIIAVHALAGMYHHYVEKDDVLKRMLPGKD